MVAPGESVVLCSRAALQLTGSGPKVPGSGQHLGTLAMLECIHQRACDACPCAHSAQYWCSFRNTHRNWVMTGLDARASDAIQWCAISMLACLIRWHADLSERQGVARTRHQEDSHRRCALQLGSGPGHKAAQACAAIRAHQEAPQQHAGSLALGACLRQALLAVQPQALRQAHLLLPARAQGSKCEQRRQQSTRASLLRCLQCPAWGLLIQTMLAAHPQGLCKQQLAITIFHNYWSTTEALQHAEAPAVLGWLCHGTVHSGKVKGNEQQLRQPQQEHAVCLPCSFPQLRISPALLMQNLSLTEAAAAISSLKA